eukprot:5077769-Amphidinium_carterae.1
MAGQRLLRVEEQRSTRCTCLKRFHRNSEASILIQNHLEDVLSLVLVVLLSHTSYYSTRNRTGNMHTWIRRYGMENECLQQCSAQSLPPGAHCRQQIQCVSVEGSCVPRSALLLVFCRRFAIQATLGKQLYAPRNDTRTGARSPTSLVI